jgi:hypothetical protein
MTSGDGRLVWEGKSKSLSLKSLSLVAFEFLANGGDEMVSGEAWVVRHAVAERGGVDGIGLRFLKFHGDGRERIEAILTQACASS